MIKAKYHCAQAVFIVLVDTALNSLQEYLAQLPTVVSVQFFWRSYQGSPQAAQPEPALQKAAGGRSFSEKLWRFAGDWQVPLPIAIY